MHMQCKQSPLWTFRLYIIQCKSESQAAVQLQFKVPCQIAVLQHTPQHVSCIQTAHAMHPKLFVTLCSVMCMSSCRLLYSCLLSVQSLHPYVTQSIYTACMRSDLGALSTPSVFQSLAVSAYSYLMGSVDLCL